MCVGVRAGLGQKPGPFRAVRVKTHLLGILRARPGLGTRALQSMGGYGQGSGARQHWFPL